MTEFAPVPNSASVPYMDNPLVRALLSYHEKIAHLFAPLGNKQCMVEVALRIAAVIVAPLAYLVLSLTALIGVCFHACLVPSPKPVTLVAQLQNALKQILPYTKQKFREAGFEESSNYPCTLSQKGKQLATANLRGDFTNIEDLFLGVDKTRLQESLRLRIDIKLGSYNMQLFVEPNDPTVNCSFWTTSSQWLDTAELDDLNDLHLIDGLVETLKKADMQKTLSSQTEPEPTTPSPKNRADSDQSKDADVDRNYPEAGFTPPSSLPSGQGSMPSLVFPPVEYTSLNLAGRTVEPIAISTTDADSQPSSFGTLSSADTRPSAATAPSFAPAVVDEPASQLAKIEKDIHKVTCSGWFEGRDNALDRCVRELIGIQEFDRAIEVAQMIIGDKKYESLFSIYEKLIEVGDGQRALQLVEKLAYANKGKAFILLCPLLKEVDHIRDAISKFEGCDNDTQKKEVIQGLCRACIRVKYMDGIAEVIAAVKKLGFFETQGLCEVCKALADTQNHQRAIEVIQEHFQWEGMKAEALKTTCEVFIRSGGIQHILDAASTLLTNKDIAAKAAVFGEICQVCVRNHVSEIGTVVTAVQALQQPEEKNAALRKICEVLIEADKLDKALEVAEMITDEHDKKQVLIRLGVALAKAGDRAAIDRVVTAASAMKEEAKIEVFERVCTALIEADQLVDKALEVAKSMGALSIGLLTVSIHRDHALLNICKAWIAKKDFNRAIAVAEMIQYEDYKNQALIPLGGELAKADDRTAIDRVVTAASAMKEAARNEVFAVICDHLIDADRLDQALEVAQRIVTSNSSIHRDHALLAICKAWIAKKDFNRAIEVAEMIQYEGYKNQALIPLGEELAKADDRTAIDRVVTATNAMTEVARNTVVTFICDRLIDADQLGEALEIAMRIVEKRFSIQRDFALEKICRAWVSKPNFDKAIELAGRIQDEEIKARVCLTICQGLIGAQNVNQAVDVLAMMPPGREERKNAIGEVCRVLTSPDGDSKIDVLLAAAKGMTHEWFRDQALEHVCTACILAQQWDQAKAAAGGIKRGDIKAVLLKSITDAQQPV